MSDRAIIGGRKDKGGTNWEKKANFRGGETYSKFGA